MTLENIKEAIDVIKKYIAYMLIELKKNWI